MKKELTTFLFLFSATCLLQAEEVNEHEASQAAMRFFNQTPELRKSNGLQTTTPILSYTLKESGKNSIYIYNNPNDQGFVLIAGDDQAPEVLGYSDKGNFQYEQLPPNAKAFINHLSVQVDAISNGQKAVADPNWDTEMKPLLKSQWGQEKPFNLKCPTYQGLQCMTGCVATAMAQVMYAHQWPAKGTGDIDYTTNTLGIRLWNDLSTSTYLWFKMLPKYSSNSDEEAIDQVAQLMADCGYAVFMDYMPQASGASNYEMARAVVENFNYDKGTRIFTEAYYPAEEWREMVKAELDAKRPLLYGGATPNMEGHQFVCDGYNKKGLFHINWGWTGTSDGYFYLNLLNPADQGTGGSSSNQAFNLYVDAVFGMQPPVENSIAKPYTLYYDNLHAVTSQKVMQVKAFEIANMSYGTFNGDLCVEIYDLASGKTVLSATEEKIELKSLEVLENCNYRFDLTELNAGTYGIRLVSVDADKQKETLRGLPSMPSPYLIVDETGISITYEEPTSICQTETIQSTFFVDHASNQIYFSDNNPIISAEIYSLQGHLIQKSENISSITLEGLQQGCYLLKWQTKNGWKTQKFYY